MGSCCSKKSILTSEPVATTDTPQTSPVDAFTAVKPANAVNTVPVTVSILPLESNEKGPSEEEFKYN